MLDLVHTLPIEAHDDKIALLYKLNTENLIAVKTPYGLTDRFLVKDVVMQGGKWGPLQCSNSIDQIGSKCIKKQHNLYYYRNEVAIPPLAMVDDLLTVSNCGHESLDTNIRINTEIEMKNLRLHTATDKKKSKCQTIHVGKVCHPCRILKVHGHAMESVKSDSYLGDILRSDGKNNQTIDERVSKGVGIVSQIFDILKEVNFGHYYFEAALTLRQSFLISGMLFNSEIWYGLTTAQIERLEAVDLTFFRKLFKVASSCPKESFYLETGSLPFSIIIQSRRLKYLHHLATRNTDEMLFRVFDSQWRIGCKYDWTEQSKRDLQSWGLKIDLKWVKSKSKFAFKNIIREKSREVAFNQLLEQKKKTFKIKKSSLRRATDSRVSKESED